MDPKSVSLSRFSDNCNDLKTHDDNSNAKDIPSSPIPITRIQSFFSSTSRHSPSQGQQKRQQQRPYFTSDQQSNQQSNDKHVHTATTQIQSLHSLFPQTSPSPTAHSSSNATRNVSQFSALGRQDGESSIYTASNANESCKSSHQSSPSSAISKLKRALEGTTSMNKHLGLPNFHLSRTQSNIESSFSHASATNTVLHMDLKQKYHQLKQKHQQSLEQCGEMQCELDKTHASLITANMMHQQQQGELTQQMKALQLQLKKNENELKEYKQSNNTNGSASHSVKTENEGDYTVNMSQLQQIQTLEEENKYKSEQILRLENEKAELIQLYVKEQQNNQNQNTSWESDIALASLKKRLQAAESLEEDRKEEIAKLQHDLLALKDASQSHDRENTKVETLTRQIQEQEDRFKEEQTSLIQSVKEKEELIHSQNQEFQRAQEKYDIAQMQIKDFEMRIQKQSRDIVEKSALVRTLQRKMEDQSTLIQELNSKLRATSQSSSPPKHQAFNNEHKNTSDLSFSNEIKNVQRSLNLMSNQLKTSKTRSKQSIHRLKGILQDMQQKCSLCQNELLQPKDHIMNIQGQFDEKCDERELESIPLPSLSNRETAADGSFFPNNSPMQQSYLQQSLDQKNMELIEKTAFLKEKDLQIAARDQLVMELRNEISCLTDQVLHLQNIGRNKIQNNNSHTVDGNSSFLENLESDFIFQEPSTQIHFLAAANTKISNLEAQVSEARGDCKAKDEAIQVMKRSLKDALSMLKPLQMLVANAEEEKSICFKNYEKAKLQIEGLKSDLNNFQKEKNSHISQSVKNKQEHDECKIDIQRIEPKVERSQEQQTQIQAMQEDMYLECEALKKTLQNKNQELLTLQMQQQTLRASCESSQCNSVCLIAKDKLEVVQSLFETLQRVLADDAMHQNQKEQNISSIAMENISSQRICSYIDVVRSLHHSREELSERVVSNKEELEDTRKRLSSLEKTTQLEIDRLQKALNEKTAKFTDVERELNSLKQKSSQYSGTEKTLMELQPQTSNVEKEKLDQSEMLRKKQVEIDTHLTGTHSHSQQESSNVEVIEEKLESCLEAGKKKDLLIEALTQRLKQTDSELQATRRKLETVLKEVAVVKATLSSCESEIEKWKSTAKYSKKQSSSLQKKISEIKKHVNKSKSLEFQKFLGTNRKIKTLEDELSSKIHQLEREFKTVLDQNTELQHRIEKKDEEVWSKIMQG